MRKTAFIYFTLMVLAYILAFIVNSIDPDLWARLAVGSIFFQTGGVLKHDIFAYTPVKDLWIDHEWGSSVLFYFLAKHFGIWGILHLKALIIFMMLVLIVKTIKLDKEKSIIIEPLYFIILAVSIFPSVASPIRCQLFTFLLFTLWIYLLEKIRKGENRLIWIFPVTAILWANMHGGFVAGFGLVGIYAIGELLNKRNPLKYLLILALSIPVTLINPYGINYWHYILDAALMPRPGINEWQPISWSDPSFEFYGISIHIFAGFVLFAFLTILVGLKSIITRNKANWVKILLFALLIYLGFSHKRHAIFFIIASSSLLYSGHSEILKYFPELVKDKFGEKISNMLVLTKYVLTYLAVIWACYILLVMPKTLIASPIHYPVGSVEFIRQNNLSGNVLTSYRWGNYILWKLYPQCLVSVDGRYEEVYTNETFETVRNFTHKLNDNWHVAVDKYKTDIIIVSRHTFTPEELNRLKNWEIVYSDAVSYLLLPKNGLKKTYIIPNYENELYWQADLAKPVKLN